MNIVSVLLPVIYGALTWVIVKADGNFAGIFAVADVEFLCVLQHV